MFIVNLNGRIGNQLFQYSFGLYLELTYGVKVVYTNDFLDVNEPSISDLFPIDLEICTYSYLHRNLGLRSNKYFRKILSRWPIKPFIGNDFFCEKNFLKISNKILFGYFHGYWQSTKYVNPVESKLRSNLQFPNYNYIIDNDVLIKINLQNSVSLHIRRGDYLNNKNSNIYNLLNFDYYNKTIEFFESKFKNCLFCIFTDDPQFVIENKFFDDSKFVLISRYDSPSPISDLYLMSKCNHNIIANSTYSWWAAWLNSNQNKIVAAPKAWYVDRVTAPELLPTSWLKF